MVLKLCSGSAGSPTDSLQSERTIYNYVQRIREEEDIPKSSEPVRQMRHVPDCEYGEKAQVDYSLASIRW